MNYKSFTVTLNAYQLKLLDSFNSYYFHSKKSQSDILQILILISFLNFAVSSDLPRILKEGDANWSAIFLLLFCFLLPCFLVVALLLLAFKLNLMIQIMLFLHLLLLCFFIMVCIVLLIQLGICVIQKISWNGMMT